MRSSCLAVIACLACFAACTEGTTTKLDGRIKRDGGKKDKGPLVPDVEQPDLEVADQWVAKPDQPVVKPDQQVVKPDQKGTIDLKKVDQGKVADKSTIDLKKPDVSKSDGPVVAGKLVINEIDYDQPGTDSAEFLEIYNGTSAAVSLADLAVVFVNGSNSTEYDRVSLASATSLPAGGYLVIAPTTVTVDPGAKVIAFTGQIQNGGTTPDGVALVNTATKQVLDALCYDGAMTSVTITGFTSPVSLVEGTALATTVVDSSTQAGSLARLPNGADTNNASSDWKLTTTLTPGKANQ